MVDMTFSAEIGINLDPIFALVALNTLVHSNVEALTAIWRKESILASLSYSDVCRMETVYSVD
jgi:hypothetical protein